LFFSFTFSCFCIIGAGVGGLFGFCSGYAMKTISKAAAVLVGIGFMGVQFLSSAGYIHPDWKKVEEDVIAKLDQNGDGKLDLADAKIAKDKLIRRLTVRLHL